MSRGLPQLNENPVALTRMQTQVYGYAGGLGEPLRVHIGEASPTISTPKYM